MLQKTHLYKEIQEQPEVIARLLSQEAKDIDALAEEIKGKKIKQVVIAARGTSDNVGRYAQYLLGAVNGLLVTLATPSLFTIYKQPPSLKNTLVLGISQSGKSPDIVSVLAEARAQGALTATITNTKGSELAKQADHIITQEAGLEKSVAATKTYTSGLTAVAMLSTALSEDKEMLANLKTLPVTLAKTLKSEEDVTRVVQRYRYMRQCVVIGRGFNYATAFEMALKLKELTYTLVEPYSSADFLHGPLAMIDHGFPVIIIAPSGKMLDEMRSFIQTLNDTSAETVVISDDPSTLKMARIPLKLPERVPEWLSPISAILPGQFLAMHLSFIRGYEPDNPRSLRKITETR